MKKATNKHVPLATTSTSFIHSYRGNSMEKMCCKSISRITSFTGTINHTMYKYEMKHFCSDTYKHLLTHLFVYT